MQVAPPTLIRCSGMTLPELLVVLAILAITLTSIGPSMFGAMEDSRLAGIADSLWMDMKLARQEAILRGHRVIICPIASNNTASCASTTSWNGGWMIFADADSSGSPTSQDDDLLSVHDPLPPSVEVISHFAINQRKIIYTPDGRSHIGGNFEIKSTTSYANARPRMVQWSAFRNPTVSYYP